MTPAIRDALDSLVGWSRSDAARWHVSEGPIHKAREAIADHIAVLEAENARLRAGIEAFMAGSYPSSYIDPPKRVRMSRRSNACNT